MIRNTISFALIVLSVHVLCALPIAAATRRAQDAHLAKVKAEVAKHEQKRDKVSVKLKDGSKLKGRITQRDEDAFTVTDAVRGYPNPDLRRGRASKIRGRDVTLGEDRHRARRRRGVVSIDLCHRAG
jgi:small nuclear ribonucleoprotein (snRNP)-like protein